MPHKDASEFEKILSYDFKDKTLLNMALTHSSTAEDTNYERLEFLGDRVLGLIMADMLYHKFPRENEGDIAKRLSALVQGSLLAEIGAGINLGDYIHFSEAERDAGGAQNEHIIADVFESILGALYLDGGLNPCREWIARMWSDDIFATKEPPQHPKTALQEWVQGKSLALPSYEITGQSGPDHAPVFEVTLSVPGHKQVAAQGKSRQEAEKQAATIFLEKYT